MENKFFECICQKYLISHLNVKGNSLWTLILELYIYSYQFWNLSFSKWILHFIQLIWKHCPSQRSGRLGNPRSQLCHLPVAAICPSHITTVLLSQNAATHRCILFCFSYIFWIYHHYFEILTACFIKCVLIS